MDIEVYSRYQKLQEMRFGTEHPESHDAKTITSWLQLQLPINTDNLIKPATDKPAALLANEDLARAENDFLESYNAVFAKPNSSPVNSNKEKLKNAIKNARSDMSSTERNKLHEELIQLTTSPKDESDANMMLGLLSASQLDRKTAIKHIKKGFYTFRAHSDLDDEMIVKIIICYDETLDFNSKVSRLGLPHKRFLDSINSSPDYDYKLSQSTKLLKTYPLCSTVRVVRAQCNFRLGDLDAFDRDFDISMWQRFIKGKTDVQPTKETVESGKMDSYYYWVFVKKYHYAERTLRHDNPQKANECFAKSIQLKEDFRKLLETTGLRKIIDGAPSTVKSTLDFHFSEACIKNDKARLLGLLKPISLQDSKIEKQKIQAELDAKNAADKLAKEQEKQLKREAAEKAKLKREADKKAAREKADKAAEDEAQRIAAENASKIAERDALLLKRSEARKIKKRDAIISKSISGLILNAFTVIDKKEQWLQTLETNTNTLVSSILKNAQQEVNEEHQKLMDSQKKEPTLIKTPDTLTIQAPTLTQVAPEQAQSIDPKPLQTPSHQYVIQPKPFFPAPAQLIKPIESQPVQAPSIPLPYYLPTIEQPLLISVSETERSVLMPLQRKIKQLAFLYGGSILDRVCGNNSSRDIDVALIAPHIAIANYLNSEYKDHKNISVKESNHRNNLCKLTIDKTKIDISGNCIIDRPYYQAFAGLHCHFTIASMLSNLSGEVSYSARALFDLLYGRITTVNHPIDAYGQDGALIFHAVRYQSKMRLLSQKRKLEEKAFPKKIFDEPIDQLLQMEGKRRKFSDINWHISQNDLHVFPKSAELMLSRSKTDKNYCSYILHQLRERVFEENGAENFIQLYALGIINILFGAISVENTKWLCDFAEDNDKTKPRSLLLPVILIAVAAGEKSIKKLSDYAELKPKLDTLINENPFFNKQFTADRSSIFSVFTLNPIKKPSLFATAAANEISSNATQKSMVIKSP